MVELSNDSGETVDAYLKSPRFHSSKSPFCLELEWLATRLAQELGLPCAKVIPVLITPQLFRLASEIGDNSLMQVLESGPEVLLASVSLGVGWVEWSPALTIPKAQVETASKIYFFDTMIQNWDRVMTNPNLLVKNGNYGMIDQEESFVEAAGSAAERELTPKPWVDDGITNDVGEFDEHPLWRGIKKHKTDPFGTAVSQWKSLPESVFRGYPEERVFDHWSREVAEGIAEYLSEARQNIDAVHMQVEVNRCK